MSEPFSSDDEPGSRNDQSFNNAVKKNKTIERRMHHRDKVMKQKLIQFKNICKLIRFQQGLKNPSIEHQQNFIKQTFSQQKNEDYQKNREIEKLGGQMENPFHIKDDAKQKLFLQKEHDKEAIKLKLIKQGLSDSSRSIPQKSIQNASQIKRETETQRNDSFVKQKSEYSTPKFISSDVDSSFLGKSPSRGCEDQSFMVQNQTIQVKPNGVKTDELASNNLHRGGSKFTYKPFSFSMIPQTQQRQQQSPNQCSKDRQTDYLTKQVLYIKEKTQNCPKVIKNRHMFRKQKRKKIHLSQSENEEQS